MLFLIWLELLRAIHFWSGWVMPGKRPTGIRAQLLCRVHAAEVSDVTDRLPKGFGCTDRLRGVYPARLYVSIFLCLTAESALPWPIA